MGSLFESEGFLKFMIGWCLGFFIVDLVITIFDPSDWSNWFFMFLMLVLLLLNLHFYRERFGRYRGKV